MNVPGRKDKILPWFVGVGGLLLVGVYLLRLHYVQDYSDPVGFVIRAMRWATVGDGSDRAPLYPVILYGMIRLLGPDWVFVANIPFIMLLLLMLGVCTRTFFPDKTVSLPAWCRHAALMLPAGLFFAVRRPVLQQMVNPYREPIALLALLLVVYLFVRGWKQRKIVTVLASGILLGLATSLRETSLLLIMPLGLWTLVEIWKSRRLQPVLALLFMAGIMVGLLPLLVKNYQFSGQPLVPAYSAGHVEQYRTTGSWDIPIPGMSIRNFPEVARATIRTTYRRYKLAGSVFLLLGVWFAFRYRARDVLYLYLPAFLIFFLFHCFYSRYLPRYLMTAEIFMVPVMVYGLLHGWLYLAAHAPIAIRNRMPVLGRVLAGFLLALFVLMLSVPIIRGDARTKVWNLGIIREEVSANIEEPAVFMGGRHFCYRLSWLLGQSYYEFTHQFQHDRERYPDLETRLAVHGRRAVERFAEGNYYIDESSFAVASNWLQRDTVFNFASVSVPFERYGQPLTGNIYRVRPWQQNQTTIERNTSRSARAILMLDMRRPWDYLERTKLVGVEAALPDVVHAFMNGVQFIELPHRDAVEPFSFQIISDAPVPAAPYWRLIELNHDIGLSFGMGADHWAWNRASSSLYPNRFIPYDSAQLYDTGEIRLPVFAETGHDVYAEVRMEFVRTHPYWYQDVHTLRMRSGEWTDVWPLPPPRHQGRYVIPIAEGTGALDEVVLHLQTTLPSHEIQQSADFRWKVPRHAFVKIYDVRVFSHLRTTGYPVVLDVGGSDAHVIGSGFFGRERSGVHTGRWTSSAANLRFRSTKSLPERVRVHVLPVRPPAYDADLLFVVNGQPVPAESIRVAEGEQRVYEFPVNVLQVLHDPGWFTLSIETTTWRPSKEGLGRDHRDLGVFVTGVELH